MTEETMTIHKALAELKILDDRIMKAIHEGTYCVANRHSNEKIKGISIEKYEETIQGFYKKATDLIKRRDAIKRAVVLSNANTKVSINGIDYTVAEAIEMKNHGVEFEKEFLNELREDYRRAQEEIDEHNGDVLEKKAEQYVIGMYGSKDTKTDSTEVEKVKKEYIKNNTYELVDPIGILKKIEELEEKICAFESEVDSALSTSNATTEITIKY